ncbi:hypothetical protein CEK25_013085 [Fusarium fujikuroi]|nr:hypothetical protein CEK25_013085 [Fusarium fujikuroi]
MAEHGNRVGGAEKLGYADGSIIHVAIYKRFADINDAYPVEPGQPSAILWGSSLLTAVWFTLIWQSIGGAEKPVNTRLGSSFTQIHKRRPTSTLLVIFTAWSLRQA